jgi:hypothetical protein
MDGVPNICGTQYEKTIAGPSTLFMRLDPLWSNQHTHKAATGFRAQHIRLDRTPGLGIEGKSARAHQIDNLEQGTASATVKGEVNADFYRCFTFSTAA